MGSTGGVTGVGVAGGVKGNSSSRPTKAVDCEILAMVKKVRKRAGEASNSLWINKLFFIMIENDIVRNSLGDVTRYAYLCK